MSVTFETEICKSWFGRPKLVIFSSHQVEGNKFTNMLHRVPNEGHPMLDVADAIQLRAILTKFIDEKSK